MAMTFRPSEELTSALKTQAEREHMSMHNLLVKAAEEYVARHDRRRRLDDALDVITVEYADALKRLGE